MKVNKFLHRLLSMFDFGGSKRVDPTPGGIPFVALIAIVPILLFLILIAGFVYMALFG